MQVFCLSFWKALISCALYFSETSQYNKKSSKNVFGCYFFKNFFLSIISSCLKKSFAQTSVPIMVFAIYPPLPIIFTKKSANVNNYLVFSYKFKLKLKQANHWLEVQPADKGRRICHPGWASDTVLLYITYGSMAYRKSWSLDPETPWSRPSTMATEGDRLCLPFIPGHRRRNSSVFFHLGIQLCCGHRLIIVWSNVK